MVGPDHVGQHRASSPRWLLSGDWWLDALERAARAAAGGALGVLSADQLAVIPGADWRLALVAAGGAAVVSLLVSVVAGRVGDPGTASFRRP